LLHNDAISAPQVTFFIENMERGEIHLIGGALILRNSDHTDVEPGNT